MEEGNYYALNNGKGSKNECNDYGIINLLNGQSDWYNIDEEDDGIN